MFDLDRPDLRMHFDFDVMKHAIAELAIRATQLIQLGERGRAIVFFQQHGYDLENRRALADAFTNRILAPRQVESYTEKIPD